MRLVDGEPTLAVQVLWRGAEINMLRETQEPLERFLLRLGLSCSKTVSRGGGDRKRRKRETKQTVSGSPSDLLPASSSPTASPPSASTGGAIVVSVLGRDGVGIHGSTPVAEALKCASYMEIDGERLLVSVNPPAIKKLEIFGKPIAGCPLVASLRCEFCDASVFSLRWSRQADSIPTCDGGETEVEGRVYVIPANAVGDTIVLRAVSGEGAGIRSACVLVGPVEETPARWPERRLTAFGARPSPEARPSTFRVVSFNMLAATYAKTSKATNEMYPYCPPEALDFEYRQPLIGRELSRLDGDLVCLQECQYSTYARFLLPLYSKFYHVRIALKASQVSEGCALLIRRDAFEVLEERDYLFRELLRAGDKFKRIFQEVKAKWPHFVDGVLPNMSTVFQVTALRHAASGERIVVANTHLFYHPQARHVRLLQAYCLLQQVQEMRERHAVVGSKGPDGCGASPSLPRVVLCGDLNCLPETAVLQLLLKGHVASDNLDWEHAMEFTWGRDGEEAEWSNEEDSPDGAALGATCTAGDSGVDDDELTALPETEWQPGIGIKLANPVGVLKNANERTEPLPFTNYVKGFKAVLDYIMISGEGLRVVGTLPGVTEEDLQPEGGLPSALYPSDHLAIAADIQLLSLAAGDVAGVASSVPA